MKREEKRKRFHEGLLNMLYPPLPQHEEKKHDETIYNSRENLKLDSITDESGEEKSSSSSSSDGEEEGEGGPGKLTRAQRKRIRKKKLKEAASRRRRKIIGPMPPTTCDDGNGEEGKEVEDDSFQGVRENATKKVDTVAESSETASNIKQGKLKCRRMAKKLGSEMSKSTSTENEH